MFLVSAFLNRAFFAQSLQELEYYFQTDATLLLSQFGTLPADTIYASTTDNLTLIYDGSFAYQGRLASFVTGSGEDHLFIGAGSGYMVGNIFISTGDGHDHITTGYIEGSNSIGAGIDAGTGNDTITVLDTVRGAGIFGNADFLIQAGAGDDHVILQGTQFNPRNASINVVDGGSGFDSFSWNLSYDLGYGTNQTGVDALPSPVPQEIAVQNFERLILNPSSTLASLKLSATDVAAITAGSEFDRSLLGLGLTGIGEALFLSHHNASVQLDLNDWTYLGISTSLEGLGYSVYSSGSALLIVDPLLSEVGEPENRRVLVDAVLGGALRIDDYFVSADPASTFTITDEFGALVPFANWDQATGKIVLSSTVGVPAAQTIVLTEFTPEGLDRIRKVDVSFTELTFTPVAFTSTQPFATTADFNGDGLTDVFGAFQNADGSFTSFDLAALGLSSLSNAPGVVLRDNRAADFDNNGTLDIVSNTYAPSVPGPNIVRLFSNDGQGQFTEVASFAAQTIQGYGETIVVADFNNDGLTDIYLPHYFRDDPEVLFAAGGSYAPAPVVGSRLLINQGDLNFNDETDTWDVTNSAGSLSLQGFGDRFTNQMPEGAQAIDFNKDGLIDLWVASHFFINQGGTFFDANRALGLPVEFEEGALLFDWNNDGWFDIVKILPYDGPVLYQFNSSSFRFEAKHVFDSELHYEDAYGVTAADLNGDSWLDLYFGGGSTLTPRIFLNQTGQSFVEYRSSITENAITNAAPSGSDINQDGRPDLSLGSIFGLLKNSSQNTTHTISIELFGPNGERNQHGRVVELIPADPLDERVIARVVDGGSGYISQGDYHLLFADSVASTYIANAYLVDYPSGASVRISFTVESGHNYSIQAASENTSAVVFDLTTQLPVGFTRTYATNALDNYVVVSAPGLLQLDGFEGDDHLLLETSSTNGWEGSSIVGGEGNDHISFSQTTDEISTPPLAGQIGLLGNKGNDFISFLAADALDVVIDSGEGDDTVLVIAANGTVTVTLGLGYDILQFASGSSNPFATGQIVVTDFESGPTGDRIDWGNFLTTYLVGWDTFTNPIVTGHIQLVQDLNDTVIQVNQDESGFVNLVRLSDVLLADLDEYHLGGLVNYVVHFGTSESELLSGGANRDYFDGKSGADTFEGFAGNDSYLVDSADDQVIEQIDAGVDIVFASHDFTLNIGQEIEFLASFGGVPNAALTLKGNEFSQRLDGNSANNVLDGRGGDDYLFGGEGNDTLFGGTGSNVLDGGAGSDTAVYHQEVEGITVTLNGASAAIVQVGDTLRDTLYNVENLTGGLAADLLTGDQFDNKLDGRNGADTLAGRGGADLYIIDDAADRIIEVLGEGVDRVVADVSYNLTFGAEVEVLSTRTHTSTETITLRGNEYAQTIYGNAGLNTLEGRGGTDTLIGFAGSDLYIVGDTSVKIFEAISGGDDRVVADVSYVLTTGAEIETLTARTRSDTFVLNLTGNEFGQNIHGNDGANTLDGRGGNDTLRGYKGDDIYILDSLGDVAFESLGEGYDKVVADVSFVLTSQSEIEVLSTRAHVTTFSINLTGNEFSQTIQGNNGINTLDGRGGADTLQGFHGNDLYIVDNVGDRIFESVGAGIDRVVADVSYVLNGYAEIETISTRTHSALQDINLTGNEFGQTIQGNNGINTLDGRGGADTLIGFRGDDRYIVDNQNDVVVEQVGNGFDRVVADVDYVLGSSAEIEVLSTRTHAANFQIDLQGNQFGQTLYGNAGNNQLTGGGGSDTLIGFSGDDTYFVDSSDDVIVEGVGRGFDTVVASGSYSLAAAVEIELLQTADANATDAVSLAGNAFSQTVTGNAGHNFLNGKAGDDTLIGGGGDDQFVFNFGFGSDIITDFDAEALNGQDLIDLSSIGINNQNFVGSAILTQDGLDTLITIDNNQIRLVSVDMLSLNSDDFLLAS